MDVVGGILFLFGVWSIGRICQWIVGVFIVGGFVFFFVFDSFVLLFLLLEPCSCGAGYLVSESPFVGSFGWRWCCHWLSVAAVIVKVVCVSII